MGSTLKTQCERLRREGKSLNEICAILGKGKSTVYAHIKNVSVSPKRLLELRSAGVKNLVAYTQTHSRLGVSAAGRHPIPFETWTTRHVHLVSHLLFDGSISHSACVYYNRSWVLVDAVQQHMFDLYPHHHGSRLNSLVSSVAPGTT